MVARTACAHAIAATIRFVCHVITNNAQIVTHELRAHSQFLRITRKQMVARTACAHARVATIVFVGYAKSAIQGWSVSHYDSHYARIMARITPALRSQRWHYARITLRQ